MLDKRDGAVEVFLNAAEQILLQSNNCGCPHKDPAGSLNILTRVLFVGQSRYLTSFRQSQHRLCFAHLLRLSLSFLLLLLLRTRLAVQDCPIPRRPCSRCTRCCRWFVSLGCIFSAIRLASVSTASPVANTNSRTSTLLDSWTCGLQALAQANYLENNKADGFLWLVIHQSVGCFWSSTFRLAIHNDEARLKESDLPVLHLDLSPPCRQPQVLWQPLAPFIFVDDEVSENRSRRSS